MVPTRGWLMLFRFLGAAYHFVPCAHVIPRSCEGSSGALGGTVGEGREPEVTPQLQEVTEILSIRRLSGFV